MAEVTEELKQKILDFFEKSRGRKSKFYIKDVVKGLPGQERSAVKKACQALLNEGKLEYWSSGSTTYLVLPGTIHEEGDQE